MELKFLLCATIIILGLLVLWKNKTLALKLQSLYVTQAKREGRSTEKWERPWMRKLFRFMVIFAGILIIIGAYPLLFGPYNG